MDFSPRTVLIEVAKTLGAISVILGILWTTVGGPHVEGFVIKTVEAMDYASKRQIDEANRKIRKNGETATRVDRRTLKMETKQETILELLKEQRQINREILQQLRRQ